MPKPPAASPRPARLYQTLITLGLAASLLALSACGKQDEATPGQKLDQAIEQSREAAGKAETAVRDLTSDAARATTDAARDATDAAREAAAKAGEAVDAARDKAGATADQAAGQAGDKLQQAQQAARSAANVLKQTASEAASAVGQVASGAATAVGEALSDSAISTRIRTDFARDSELSTIAIGVDTNDGVVTLRGEVPTAAARSRAENLAKTAKGVTSVRNELTVR